ncbi:hypothetical protein MNBD_NITROSPIRAE03-278, partial [hydrothermal vent metagenome]
MRIPTLPDNVKVHPNVLSTIKQIAIIDNMKAGRIIQRIAALGFDPLPDTEECNSGIVQNLRKKKVFVHRLKCVDTADYRIFYAHKRSGMVCVYYVVPRNDDTYNKDSWHYQMIKLLYTQ